MNISTLDFTTLSTSVPRTPFGKALPDGQDMRFIYVQNKGRQFQIVIHAAVSTGPKDYNGDVSFISEPVATELDKLIELENLLEEGPYQEAMLANLHIDDVEYEHRPTINTENKLRLKLKTNPDGTWKFTTNDATFNTDSTLVPGTKFAATVVPGFYFNESDKKYGLFYTLKDLQFEKKTIKKQRK